MNKNKNKKDKSLVIHALQKCAVTWCCACACRPEERTLNQRVANQQPLILLLIQMELNPRFDVPVTTVQFRACNLVGPGKYHTR